MASSSGTTATAAAATSSGNSYPIQSSGSDPDLQIDQKKRKRMISNRESARRSRMRKQKHVDDLTNQLIHLRKENNQIMSSITITKQHWFNVETENHVLRVQVDELSRHLQSLNGIIGCMCPAVDGSCGVAGEEYGGGGWPEFVDVCGNRQGIVGSEEMFMY